MIKSPTFRLLFAALALALLAGACGSSATPIPIQAPDPSATTSFDPFAGFPTNSPQPTATPCPTLTSAEMTSAAAGPFRLESGTLIDAPLVVDRVSGVAGENSITFARYDQSPPPVSSEPDLGGVVAGQSAVFTVYQDVPGAESLVLMSVAGQATLDDGSPVTVSPHGGGLLMAYPASTVGVERTLRLSVSWGDGCQLFGGFAMFRFHQLP
jgi:hypothetical protein